MGVETMLLAAAGSQIVGAGISAAGTIASGNYAAKAGKLQRQAAEHEAQQIEQNAAGEVAAGQRRMFDRRLTTSQLVSTHRARAAASGVDAATGSAVENEGQIEKRGEYVALMDMHGGELTASGLRNKATAVRYGGDLSEIEGEMKKRASRFAAAGTLASGIGSSLSGYAGVRYPAPTRRV